MSSGICQMIKVIVRRACVVYHKPKTFAWKAFVDIYSQPVLDAHIPTTHSLSECPTCIGGIRIDIVNGFKVVLVLVGIAVNCRLNIFFTKFRRKNRINYLTNDKYSFFGPQPAALSALLGYAPKPAIVHTKQNKEKELQKLSKMLS